MKHSDPNRSAWGTHSVFRLWAPIKNAKEYLMSQQATVVAFKKSSGRIALRSADGSFVLAEQTDAKPMAEGLSLEGNMSEFGPEVWSDARGQTQYEVFVLGWDLSAEAIEQAM